MLRRIMNVVMAVTGPIFYGVFSRLPYIVAGSLCLVYACVFIVYTQKQQKQNAARVAKLFSANTDLDENDAEEMVQRYNRMTMASRECLARMASCTYKVIKLAEENDDEVGRDEDQDGAYGGIDAIPEEENEEKEEEANTLSVGVL